MQSAKRQSSQQHEQDKRACPGQWIDAELQACDSAKFDCAHRLVPRCGAQAPFENASRERSYEPRLSWIAKQPPAAAAGRVAHVSGYTVGVGPANWPCYGSRLNQSSDSAPASTDATIAPAVKK